MYTSYRWAATARILCQSEPRLQSISVNCSRSGSSLSQRLHNATPSRRSKQYAGCFDDIWLSNLWHNTVQCVNKLDKINPTQDSSQQPKFEGHVMMNKNEYKKSVWAKFRYCLKVP